MTDKIAKLLFVCSAVACTGLRVFLKLTSVDPKTGFYTGNPAAVTALNWVFGLSVAALILLGLSRRRIRANLRFGAAARFLAILTGFSVLWYSIHNTANQLYALDIGNLLRGSLPAMLSGLLVLVMMLLSLVIAPILTGLLYLLIGLRGRDNVLPAMNGWLMLAPLVWQVGLLISSFMSYTAIRSVSDQMFIVVLLILSVLFQLSHARLTAGIDVPRGARQLMAFGLPLAVTALSTGAGLVAASIAGKTVRAAMGLPAGALFLCMGAYAAILCFSLRSK